MVANISNSSYEECIDKKIVVRDLFGQKCTRPYLKNNPKQKELGM
jgi:hypothetical protein